MAKELPIPFPLRGVDYNWAFNAQPKGTTPSANNFRSYSFDLERARGGSRPGVKRAYADKAGGSNSHPVQWIGWLDYGFGDAVFYDEPFQYDSACLLNTLTVGGSGTGVNQVWAAADAQLVVTGGAVHSAGTAGVEYTSGEYAGLSGDEWNDFTLDASIAWTRGIIGSVFFWVSSATAAATNGITLKIEQNTVYKGFPIAEFEQTVQVTLAAGATSKTWGFTGSNFTTASNIHLEVDQKNVKLNYNGANIISFARPSTNAVCSKAGFKIKRNIVDFGGSTPIGFSSSTVDVQLTNWSLTAKTNSTANAKKLVTVCNGSVYAESAEGTLSSTAETSATVSATPPLVSAAHCNGSLFIVDGTAPIYYGPMSTTKTNTWTARKGKIDPACRLICNWRNRLVLANTQDNPQIFYMTRVDDPYDFEYFDDDAQSAVPGDLYTGGRIGRPIQALCPINDNMLVFGTTHELWCMMGDPLSGGVLRRVTDQAGIVCQNAWCADENGRMYFVGEHGLYRWSPGDGPPECISDKRIPALDNIRAVQPGRAAATGEVYVTLLFDPKRMAVCLYLTPTSGATGTTGYYYDTRNDAFWPESFPIVMGPTCAAFYDAKTVTYAHMILGGTTGYLYRYDDSSKSDIDGETTTAISSNVLIPCGRLAGGVHDYILTRLVGVLGTNSDAATVTVIPAASPELLVAGTAQETFTWSAGRNHERPRVRGGTIGIKLANATAGKALSVESITGEAEPLGVQR